MNRIFVAILIGSTVISAVPSSALAFYCVARSINGVSGPANSALLWKAPQVAWRACVAAGGNRNGGASTIVGEILGTPEGFL
jgi:hypothetical protein